jgi:hypothetical protein
MSDNKTMKQQQQQQQPMIDRFRWKIKAIALPCPREFIYRDDSRARLVQKQDMIIFYEHGMMDVMLPEQLQNLFQSEFSSDPNLLIYSKTSEVTVQKMDDIFTAYRGNYCTRGEPGDYLVQDTISPFNQYALNESQLKSFIKGFQSFEDEDDEGDETHQSQSLESQSIESKEESLPSPAPAGSPIVESEFDSIAATTAAHYFTERERYLCNRNELLFKQKSQTSMASPSPEANQNVDISVNSFLPQEIAELTKFVKYEESSDVRSYSWNLKNHSYLAIRVMDEKLSVEFPDHPIICRSQRYTGVRGDYLILNTSGYFFAIVSPAEFEMLFKSEPYRGNISLIQGMKCENVLGLEIEQLASAFWNRTVEYGKSGDHLLQFSPPLGAPDSPVYQWILSKSEFLELFDPSPDEEDLVFSAQRSDSVADGQEFSWNEISSTTVAVGPSFANPFHIFDANTPCWKGFLRRFIRQGEKYHLQWKPVYAEIYPDQIILNPFSENPRKYNFLGCTSLKNETIFEAHCIIADGIAGVKIKKKTVSASVRGFVRSASSTLTFFNRSSSQGSGSSVNGLIDTAEYFTIYQGDGSDLPPSILSGDIVIADVLSSEYSKISLAGMTKLFRACRSWAKRKQLCELIFRSFQSGKPISADVFSHLFSKLQTEFSEDWPQILTEPIDKKFGQETIVHLAIQCDNKSILQNLFHHPYDNAILDTDYHQSLTRRSYACCVKNAAFFSIIKMPEDFYSGFDPEGNTLLMLLLARGSYAAVSSLITQRHFSKEFLNTQNFHQESLLSHALRLLLLPSARGNGEEVRQFLLMLLEHGCDPNLRDSDGNTCLHFLCFMFNSLPSDDESMVSKLLITQVIKDFVKISDISARNDGNETPLSLFVRMKDDLDAIVTENQTVNLLDIVDLLLGSSLAGILNPPCGPSPLLICAERGLSSLFDYLISKGGDFRLRSGDSGETPLDIISRRMQELRNRLFLTSSDRHTLSGLNRCYEILMRERTSTVATEVEIVSESDTLPNPNEIIFHRSGGRLEIKSGQIFALVHYLSSHEPFSEVDARALVAGYPSLCDHGQFFKLLLSEFDAKVSSESSTDSRIEISSLGMLGLLFVWVVHRQSDAGRGLPPDLLGC